MTGNATSMHNRPAVPGRDGTATTNPSRPPIEGTGGTPGRPEGSSHKEERAHAAIAAATAQLPGHTDRGTNHRCPACHAPVIRALDDTVAAFTAVADPHPLDRAGELTALLTGRDTYALTLVPRLTLRRRDRWQISGRPADTLHVVAEHRCHAPLGTPAPPADDRSTASVCPF